MEDHRLIPISFNEVIVVRKRIFELQLIWVIHRLDMVDNRIKDWCQEFHQLNHPHVPLIGQWLHHQVIVIICTKLDEKFHISSTKGWAMVYRFPENKLRLGCGLFRFFFSIRNEFVALFFVASTTKTTPSTIFMIRSTSPPKSACPGVSMMLIRVPQATAVFFSKDGTHAFSISLSPYDAQPIQYKKCVSDCFNCQREVVLSY